MKTKKQILQEIKRLNNYVPESYEHFKTLTAAMYALEWVTGMSKKKPSVNYKRPVK